MMNNIIKKIEDFKERKKFDAIKKFKDSHDFEHRKEESDRILAKYPDRIPIIVEPFDHNVPIIDRKKYLVPEDLSVSNFLYVIRKRVKMKSEESLYLFINGKIMNNSKYLAALYQENKDEDGFLYVVYSTEATFG